MSNTESLQVFSGKFPTTSPTTVAGLSTETAYRLCLHSADMTVLL